VLVLQGYAVTKDNSKIKGKVKAIPLQALRVPGG
jgi:hypothetical protein